MNRVRLDPKLVDIESLLAAERELVPVPEDTRKRVIQRAQASMPRFLPVQLVSRSPRPRRLRIGHAATAAVMLTAVCAIAFRAGYQMKSRSSAAPAVAPAVKPSVIVPSAPMATPSSLPPEEHEPLEPQANAKPTGPAKSATEAYAMELRVLQPAQQAVARRDFASALAAIAEHQRRFPSGKLAEEREALRVKALLGLGRTAEAQRAGVAFRKRFPKSALRGRMDEMLSTQR